MTAASKSALIEQLKARHSSQQQKLQELASRVEQTRNDNRRLRNTLLALVAAAIVIPVVIFHDRIFPHSPATTPLAPTMGTSPAKPPPPAAAHKPAEPEWLLQLTGNLSGKDIALSRKSIIPRSFHPQAVPDPKQPEYAEVAWDKEKKATLLINESTDTWSLSTGHKVRYGQEIELGGERLTIDFAPGLSGTIAPTADAAPAEAGQP